MEVKKNLVKPPIVDMPESDIVEVVRFREAETSLVEFMRAHSNVISRFSELADKYNAALKIADAAVRNKQVSCGPFTLNFFSTRIDAEVLCKALGKRKFSAVGGTVVVKPTYVVDKTKLELATIAGEVPENALAKAVKYIPTYHVPPALVIPR